MNPLPVQPAKIHRPPRRDDTLTRERLNSWLERASAGRLGLIVAEAGFGKTTLLADWAGLTRRQTAWYRLEPDDRDWLTFIRHLVAGGRELDPEFAPDTLRGLLSLGPGGPGPKDLAVSIAREMAEFGIASSRGLTLILDDYHVVDGCSDTEPIVRALLDRTGPGFSVVIATRSKPTLPMGRIRTRGGVMTIAGPDLCFDVDETARLFRDAYHHPLDQDVVSDLHDRTDGWAALLTLVRTSLEEQDDPRTLVEHLDASRGDLHDFLAEEVLATLPSELQHFLTRVAVLTAVDVEMAMLVDERSAEAVAASIRESDRLGLLSRPDRETPHRFHPLVRDFLVARLTAEIGKEAVRELHQHVAEKLRASRWFAAAWHYREAGKPASAAEVVDSSASSVLAAGQLEQTRQFLDGSAGSIYRTGAVILRSRLELERGNLGRAIDLAQEASEQARGTDHAGLALLNLTAVLARHGFDDRSVELASQALGSTLSTAERQVAEATVVVSSTQDEGDLAAVADYLASLALVQDAAGHARYAGITRLNLAGILLWQGRPREAGRVAARAEVDLGSSPSSPEWVAATVARAASQIQLGHVQELDRVAGLIEQTTTPIARDEAAVEAARLLGDYGSLEGAESAASRVGVSALAAGYQGAWAVATATLALRRGDPAAAARRLAMANHTLLDAAGKFRIVLLEARILLANSSDEATGRIAELARIAAAQGSRLEELLVALLAGFNGAGADSAIGQVLPEESHVLSLLAEEVCRSLPEMGDDSRRRVWDEASLRPDRWVTALRLVYLSDPTAAGFLCDLGTPDDAAALRSAASSRRWLRPLAARISRRLAPQVLLRDLGPVTIDIGGQEHQRTLRRKVLGLLCYVATRPGMACTRDEALDAIWPDLGPDTAANSLHQTIYYLRRVFEPSYKEGMSAGYLEFDGDVLTLDRTLVDADSRRCWRLVAKARRGDTAAIEELVSIYRGTYALDFAYEDWATDYRENLHAAVLGVVEAGAREAIRQGDPEFAIALAQRVLAIDPAADAIELELLRAYKVGGWHSAAAEQYAHYAAYVRGELGVEPVPYRDI